MGAKFGLCQWKLSCREVAHRFVFADVDNLGAAVDALDHPAQNLAVAHLHELVDAIVEHVVDTVAPLDAGC